MVRNEIRIDLTEAAKLHYPKRTHPSSVWRHCRRGIQARNGVRIRLEHVRCGGKIFTTAESINRFFTAVASADIEYFDLPAGCETPNLGFPRNETQRERDIARAEKTLEADGI